MQEITKEIWRPIRGYEGLYEVSSEGKIKSLDRYASNGQGIILYRGKVLKPKKHKMAISKQYYVKMVSKVYSWFTD